MKEIENPELARNTYTARIVVYIVAVFAVAGIAVYVPDLILNHSDTILNTLKFIAGGVFLVVGLAFCCALQCCAVQAVFPNTPIFVHIILCALTIFMFFSGGDSGTVSEIGRAGRYSY